MNNLKKVQSGDALEIPASTFNAFVDAAVDHRQRQRSSTQTARDAARQADIVLVKNSSGADRGRFDILGVDGPLFTPTDNADEFKNRVALDGVTPDVGTHDGKFVILLEPVASGQIGRAVASGVCAVKIAVEDEDHTCADVNDGQAGSLLSATTGAAAILWKESGTGEKWAIVRFAGSGQAISLFGVKVTEDGSGSAGSDTTLCTFKYTVDDLDGAELAVSKAPKKWRDADTMYEMEPPADDAIGLAYYDENGDLQLYDANEVPILESGGSSSGTGGTDVVHRIKIPDGSSAGSYTFDSGDWRGKIILCLLQVVADDTPEDSQWGGGATSGITRYFGSSYSGSDKLIVYTTGATVGVGIRGGSGNLYWSWQDNDSGYDFHGICRILASDTKTSPDYTV